MRAAHYSLTASGRRAAFEALLDRLKEDHPVTVTPAQCRAISGNIVRALARQGVEFSHVRTFTTRDSGRLVAYVHGATHAEHLAQTLEDLYSDVRADVLVHRSKGLVSMLFDGPSNPHFDRGYLA